MSIAPGTRFDRYQILSPIGTGGMGEIYLAQDTRLGRKVALKLLPIRYTQDHDRLRRFEQEAYAASALNHPNIITIYEIGEVDGRHFIATEFIEGVTLRRRLLSSRLSINDILNISTQVLSALATAHTAGIVHRDIKPENVMIRPDGVVKVLDFGLAKLTEKADMTGPIEGRVNTDEIETNTADDFSVNETSPQPVVPISEDLYATFPPATVKDTIPGVVLGTAQYMSPEQSRGWRVDSRTDIFSFGIVLYEMIAGRAPFGGQNSREIIASILNNEPPQLARLRPEVPELLEWITAKALVKDREERYQSAKEISNDLKRLQQRIGIEQELSRSRKSNTSGDVTTDTHTSGQTTQEIAARSGGFGRLSGYLDHQFGSFRSNRFKSSLLIITIAVLLGAAGLEFYQFLQSRSRMPVPFQPMQVKRFTTSGKATRAAISPDGKYVVYVQRDAGKQNLFVRQVTTSNSVEIVKPADVIYRGLTFTPDGQFVYYVVQEQNNPIQVLYQVPVLGGPTRKILVDIDSPIAISPDNSHFAFVRRYRGKGEDALIIANIDGSNERTIASRKGADFFGVSGPSWSPDGKIIACPAGSNTGGRHMYVAEIIVANGQEKPITTQRWANMGRVSWMGDGRGLIVRAMEQGSALFQVWYIPYPKGISRRITNDLNNYFDMSLTEDSTALVTIQSEAQVNVWLIPINDPAQAKQITDGIGQYNGVRGLTWTLDGRLVYVSQASGSQDIWIMDQNGKNNIQLTTETLSDRDPAVSPDSRYIVFVSTRTGNSNIYRIDLQTRDQKQLTNGTSEEFPAVSADGRWVIYNATGSTNFTMWKVGIDGGEPIKLTDRLTQWPAVSPDGQMITCWYRSEPSARWQIALIPIEGGNPVRVFDVPSTAETPIPIRWMPDGKGISYVDTRDGISNIWNMPLDGSPPHQLTNFTSNRIFWFDWSRDGKQLACSRGTETSDVVLINEFK